MKPIYILKIGGSVATYKNRLGMSTRKTLLKEIGRSIKKALRKDSFGLILIHGAGAMGHQLAKKYNLAEGTGINPKKWRGALISRLVNNKLNVDITEILVSQGLRIAPVHTATAIIQKNKKIDHCDLEIIKEALCQGCIPLLYGEMVFDVELGMSICSGDAIAPYLAEKLGAQKIFFASDIDGVFTKDPHVYKGARLVKKINLKDVSRKASLTDSHNIDTTGGLLGKIQKLDAKFGNRLKSIEIFNGFQKDNYEKIFAGKDFSHTVIIP
ncbi:MAG: isopentenyl phosphate kinase [Patescibacteria group bacterium]|nr:isopentenyl phosphate kinase [Patescibacteria group bacterium]